MRRLLLAALLFAAAAAAQTQLDADKPADAVAAAEPAVLAPGAQGTLRITLKIMEGGHANSNVPADPNMVPTTFTAKPAEGVVWGRPHYPEPQMVREWYAADPLSVFTNDSVITIPFTIDKSAHQGPVTLAGSVFIQVCDHEQCYPPSNLKIAVPIKVEAAARK